MLLYPLTRRSPDHALENVGKRMGADLLLNFLELTQSEVRRVYLPHTWLNGPLSPVFEEERL
jgi:hypothetical protein